MRRRLFVSIFLLAGLVLASSAGRAVTPTPHGCGSGCMAGIYTAHGSAAFDGDRFFAGGTLTLIAGTPGVAPTRTFAIVATFRNSPSALATGTFSESTGEGGEHSRYSIIAIRKGSNIEIVGISPTTARAQTAAITTPGGVVGQLFLRVNAITGHVVLDPTSCGSHCGS